MNSLVENLNGWGGQFLDFAWPMLWQSSLLIGFVFGLDFLLARKIRASVRYALWLAVLVKLILPPTLALPTGAAWWLFQGKPVAVPVATHFTVSYSDAPMEPYAAPPTVPMPVVPPPTLEAAGWAVLAAGGLSAGLLLWLAIRWWQVSRMVRRATVTEEFSGPLAEALRLAGMQGKHVRAVSGAPGFRLKIVEGTMSPAVCGLFRPVILLPRALAEKLSPSQLRAVLLHEIFHLRRRDVWVNCGQALLQIVYWWHPLLWAANARIRRVREEAVDDAVMLALRGEADGYAPTLLEVAKLAFRRPLLSLGLVGIMESRSALWQRIERLVDFRAPRKAGLTFASLCGIFVFSAVALPMGEAPATPEKQAASGQYQSSQLDVAGGADTLLALNVNPSVFIKNVMAQAGQTFHTTNDSYMDILADILRREDVDCTPPHTLTFDAKTSDIIIENSLESQETFQRVIEQLNRADGNCVLPLKPAASRRQVLITGQFYAMSTADFKTLVAQLGAENIPAGKSFVGLIAAAHTGDFDQMLEALRLSPFLRPRVETSPGRPAEFFCGNGTNGVEFDCMPYIGDGVVDLTFSINTVGDITSDGILLGNGKQTFSSRNIIEDHGRMIVCVNNPDGSYQTNFVAVLGVEILTNAAPARFQQRLQAITSRPMNPNPYDGGDSNVMGIMANPSFRATISALEQRTRAETAGMPPAGTASGSQNSMNFINIDNTFPPTAQTNAGGVSSETKGPIVGVVDAWSGNGDAKEGATNLYTRTFKVDSLAFISGLKQTGVDPGGNMNVTGMARNYFTKLGVNLWSPPGKAVFYNDRSELLFVKATEADLDVIDKAIQKLMYTPPQIHIKARFVEVPKGTFLVPSNSTLGPVTGILNSKNLKLTWNRLQASKGFEELGEPEITTLTGRQCQMRSTQIITVITNFTFQANPTNDRNPAILPQTSEVETGPILDVVPYVLSDGYTINLALIPSMTEITGYANTIEHIHDPGVHLPVILPNFTVRQVVAVANVWDGQTVVLSGLPEKDYVNGKEVKSKAGDKELLIFVTATIVDPAGNRVHTDAEMPFAQSDIPPQPKSH